jgi:hypothetical protein
MSWVVRKIVAPPIARANDLLDMFGADGIEVLAGVVLEKDGQDLLGRGLPAPFGPREPKISPGSTWKSSPEIAVVFERA